MARVLSCFRGSYRQHATKGFCGNKGDPSGSSLACRVRQAEKRERSEGLTEVRLPVSTSRTGEPATWGSGQQRLNCSWET